MIIDNQATRIYRWFVFPFVKLGLLSRHVVFRVKGYADHNTTFGGDNFIGQESFLSGCHLGRGTYVTDFSKLFQLTTGKYCSIGSGVSTAIGRHPSSENIATTPSIFSINSPNNLRFSDIQEYEEQTGPVTLGNDVWVGAGAILIGGITVGDGAIIGAGSVVTKDCEPYGVYAGCPARLIKRRFDDETIEKLLELKWWDKDDKWLRENAESFANPGEFFA